MEHLSYLRKLYEYGETLSADELNEIVQYINTSIETINILIDREYAINNGHCEVRYKNSGQQPTKPSTGSNGYSDGWSATYTEPNTEQGESTWMSICFLNGNGEYGVWSSPVRISWGSVSGGGSGGGSGEVKDGEPGAFKSRVFKRQNTKPARPIGGSYSNPVPPGWYDGIPQGLAIIWSSVCTFYGDGTSSGWSDPAQESDTANLDIEYSPRTDCPPEPMGDIPFSNHEAEGWYDPNSPNFNNYEMIWRAERKVSNGVYDGLWVISCIIGEGGEQGPPGKTGGHHESRYKNHQITPNNLVPIKPATGTDGTQNGWSIQQPSLTGEELLNGVATFMSQCFVNEDGEYGVWTLPMRITGENGKDGEDGDEVEFIYTRRESEWPNPQAPFSPQIDDWSGSYQGVVWTDNPKGVSRLIPYEYVCQRNKINGTWYPYSVPAVWSKFGLNGRDGDGVEYVFIRTASDVAPTITNSDDTYEGKTYLDDDYLPLSSAGRCTDNPVGGNHNLPYEWVAKRSKGEPDIDSGARIWHKYSGTMSLWSTFTENVVRLDLDNENDSMLYSSSKGLVSGHVVTTGYLFDGQRDVSAYAAWSIYSQTGCIASMTGRTVTVTSMGALSGSVVVQAIYNGETYTATLTLKKIIDGDKYDLIIIPNAISYNNTTDTPNETTITVEIWRTTADGVRENVAPPQGTDGYSTYILDGQSLLTSSNAKKFTYTVDNSEHRDLTVKISKGVDSNEYLDCETIPICKSTDGLSTFKSTMFVRMNNTPTKPANNKGSYDDPSPSGCLAGTNSSNTQVYWEDGIPAGENMLWETSRVFTSTGQSPQEASWSTPRQMTDTASYDVEFAKRYTNDGVPPEPSDANRHGSGAQQIWFDPTNDSSEDFTKMFWRAEREKKNGAWGSWTILRIKGEKGDNSVRIDLDNESDIMLYSSTSGLISGNVTSTGYLYDGMQDVTSNATWSIKSQAGCTASLSGSTITVTGMSAASGNVVLQASYNGTSYTATLTLKKIIDGDKYSLIVRPNAISYNNTTDNPPTTTLNIEVWCTSADGTRELKSPSLIGYSTYVMSGSTHITSSDSSSFSVNITNSQYNDITVKIAKGWNSNDCQDYETIPINKATNGTNGSQGPQGNDGKDGKDGSNGAQGQYEVKQYAISNQATSTNGSTPPIDCNAEGDWTSVPPVTTVNKPYLWQRVRMYNPATNSYSTNWVYMRVTGEKGTPGEGKTGLWYSYAGVWGVDCGPGTNNPVKNTDKIGYYVQTQGGEFYMNVAPANEANNNNPGGANWVQMQSDFKYIITKAVFSDYAQLGSFIINSDWFISKFGEICDHSQTLVNPTYVTIGESNYLDKYSGKIPYEWFDPTDPSGTTWVGYGITFAPNLAMDGKTGKVYFNRAYLKGQINATSGYIGDWKIENGNITASSSNCPYISLQQTGTSRHIRMGQPSGTFDTLLYSTNPGGKSITAYGSGTGGIGLQAYASTSGSTGVNVTALSDGSTGVSISKGNNSGRALEVTGGETYINTSKNTIYGDTIFDSGAISFRGSIKTSNFTLPESPITGTIFFCKGNNLTVTTRGHKITEGSDSSTLVSTYSSHNFEQTTFMLIFLGSQWALLYSA